MKFIPKQPEESVFDSVRQPLPLSPLPSPNLFKLGCFSAGKAWLKFRSFAYGLFIFIMLFSLSACAGGGGYRRAYIISDTTEEPVCSEPIEKR